jgi:hypothetical protein
LRLDRSRQEDHVGEGDVLALEARVRRGPELAHRQDVLVQSLPATLKVRPEPAELHLVIARAHPEHQPSVAQAIERRHFLGHDDWTPLGQYQHRDAELDPSGHRRQIGNDGQRLQRVREALILRAAGLKDDVSRPDRIVAESLRLPGNLDQDLSCPEWPEVRQGDSKAHRAGDDSTLVGPVDTPGVR